MLRTRLTAAFGLRHPVIAAPMALASGGRLAAAVSRAGGLGLIGGGYADPDWVAREFAEAGAAAGIENAPIGCGFITWALAERPRALEVALEHRPRAVFLSFGDPAPFAPAIRDAGAELICQVQSLEHARAALGAGARVIVAQGTAAGGHGARRATLTLVPEVADLLAREAPETLLCAAGGIGDGRGLAAALTLGADGVVVGSRFWASGEALVHPGLQAAAVAAGGDDTLRTSLVDIVRGRDWPAPFDIRVLRNAFSDRWQGREAELREAVEAEGPRWARAAAEGDAAAANPIVGEAAGLIRDIRPATEILAGLAAEAEAALRAGAACIAPD